jgi:large subunit ribosomal protein L22
MQASLTNYRQSPRKVRLVTNLVKGKTVNDALMSLRFLDKRAAHPIEKLISSAFANAKQQGTVSADDLIVFDIQVNKGVVLKRMMPRARGSAARIHKHSSHVLLVLAPKGLGKKKGAVKEAPVAPEVSEVKVAAKRTSTRKPKKESK